MTSDWRRAVAEQPKQGRLLLNADVLGDAVVAMSETILQGETLTLDACKPINLPDEVIGFEGKCSDLRGQDGKDIGVRLILFDRDDNDGTPDCILAVEAQTDGSARQVESYLNDFDADLDLLLAPLVPLPGFVFCSSDAPPSSAIEGAGLAQDWPAPSGLRKGVNLAFGSVGLEDDLMNLLKTVFDDNVFHKLTRIEAPGLVHVRKTPLAPYLELDAPPHGGIFPDGKAVDTDTSEAESDEDEDADDLDESDQFEPGGAGPSILARGDACPRPADQRRLGALRWSRCRLRRFHARVAAFRRGSGGKRCRSASASGSGRW